MTEAELQYEIACLLMRLYDDTLGPLNGSPREELTEAADSQRLYTSIEVWHLLARATDLGWAVAPPRQGRFLGCDDD